MEQVDLIGQQRKSDFQYLTKRRNRKKRINTHCIPRAATELIKLATVGEDDEGNLSITENR